MRNGIVSLFLITLFFFGCSGVQDISSHDVENARDTSMGTSHYTWGLWQFVADPEAQTLEVVQLRQGSLHLNAMPFLEPPPYTYLTLEGVQFQGNQVEIH